MGLGSGILVNQLSGKEVLMGSFCQFLWCKDIVANFKLSKLNNQLTKFLFNNQLCSVSNTGSCVSLGLDVTDNPVFQDEFSARLKSGMTYNLLSTRQIGWILTSRARGQHTHHPMREKT